MINNVKPVLSILKKFNRFEFVMQQRVKLFDFVYIVESGFITARALRSRIDCGDHRGMPRLGLTCSFKSRVLTRCASVNRKKKGKKRNLSKKAPDKA